MKDYAILFNRALILHPGANMTAADSSETQSTATPFEETGKKWISRSILIIVLLLAATPPTLVVADRWFSVLSRDWNRDVWCQVPFLCQSMLPSYFLVILGCFVALGIILWFAGRKTVVVVEKALVPFEMLPVSPSQTSWGQFLLVISGLVMVEVVILSILNQHWPGWDLVIAWVMYVSGWALRAVPLTALRDFWKRDGEYWVSLLLMHIAILTVLAATYEVTQIFYFSLLFLALAFGNLWRFRQRIPAIFWIISIALVFYTIKINDWSTAIVGDDYGFHALAWTLAEKTSFAQLGGSLFQANGVYNVHPYFSSFLQAISMKFFGHHSFGWRFSSLYLSAMGIGLFYFFCKSFLSQRAALIAACLLACSHYVMSFGKIGYNNLQALFALSLTLAIASWAIRWKQPFAFALLGSAIAFCFYLYPAALYIVPIPILLLLFYYPPASRQAVGHWLVMVAIWVALIYPLLIQPIYWQTKMSGTALINVGLGQSLGILMQRGVYNLFYTIFSPLYIAEGVYVNLYVNTAYVDPLTAAFVLIGYFILLYQMRRQRFAIFTALAFVIFLFLVGASHARDVPPTTRMFLMLPWFALFAAWGILWVEQKVSSPSIWVWGLVIVIAGTNVYQAYYRLSPMQYTQPQSTGTLFIAVTQNIYKAQPDKPKNIAVILENTWSYGFDSMLAFQDIYPYLAWFHLYPIFITGPSLPDDKTALFSDPDTIILIPPSIDPEWQKTLDAPLAALGKARCDILVPDVQKRMVFYYPPELPSICTINP
jgi:hypothetical protein